MSQREPAGNEGEGGPAARAPEQTLTPLDRLAGSLSRRVYLSLREAILELRYQPGERLRKRDICALLGVSRSPVSEAVQRLAAEGLVRVVPQAGTFVARLSMAEIREGAFLREALELAAVEEIAREVTDDLLGRLRRNLRVQRSDVAHGDYADFYAMDRAFHRMILEATGYPRLAELADTLWVQVDRARRLILPRPGRVRETLKEHERVMAALEARDPEAARREMRSHLRQLLRHVEPLEKSHPELFDGG